ncbi:hypothetical protein LA080_009577 [Diaporthe eres]|nr:hypothetical protein LA080_009577 [Diaporthe eres]
MSRPNLPINPEMTITGRGTPTRTGGIHTTGAIHTMANIQKHIPSVNLHAQHYDTCYLKCLYTPEQDHINCGTGFPHSFFGVYNDQHFYYSDDRQIHLGDNKGAQNKDNLSTVSSHQHYLCVRVHRNSRDRRRSTSDSNGRGYQRNIVNSGGYKAHKLAEHILLGSPE